MIRIYPYLLLLLFSISTNLYGQDKKPPVRIEGRITNYLTGQSLAGATIEVYKNGTLTETKTTSSSGKYKLSDLELDNKYKIILKNSGMVTRFVELDLTGIPNEDVFEKGWDVPIDIPLVERLPSIDFSTLEPRRTSIIKHNKSTGELDWNMGDIESYKKELEKLLKKIEAEKKKIEEEKAAQEKKYNDAMIAAEAAMKGNNYQLAIDKYKEALAAKPGDKGAVDKLTVAETKYKQFEGESKNKAEYAEFMKAGDEKFKTSDYDNAIASYKQALTKIPNDPTANKKIADAETAKKNGVDKQYTDLLARADKAYKEKDYGQAKNFYKEASVIKPTETLPNQKIKEIDDIIKKDMENETKYASFIADANKAVLGKKFDDAIAKFNEALKIRPGDAEATKGLADAKTAKAAADKDLADAANKQKQFDALVAQADKDFAAKNYTAAIKGYEDALLKFDNPDVKKKKFDAEAALKKADEELAAKNAAAAKKVEYDKFIADGNSSLAAKTFDEAIAKYQSALATGVNNVEANKKIADAQAAKDLALKADQAKADAEKKKTEFNNLIASGDAKLSSKDFANSLAEYNKALALKVDDATANAKIKAANDAKAAYDLEQKDAAAKAEALKKKEAFDALIASGDSKLSSKDFTNSLAEYNKALAMKVDDATANAKIKAANDAKAAYDLEQKDAAAQAEALKKKEAFDALIASGDSKLSSKDFTNSLAEYNKALALKVDDATANAKIKAANDAKAAYDLEQKDAAAKAEAIKKKEAFDALIASGDSKLSSKDFTNSIAEYNKALLMKVDDATANSKIKAANDAKAAYDLEQKDATAKADALKKKAEFDILIAAGDKKLSAKDFDNSIVEYKKALAMKVDDAAANAKIQEATDAKSAFEKDKASQADAAAKKKLYDAAIANAQKDFDAGEFTAAIEKYNTALTYVPDDAFAKGQIEKANLKIKEKQEFAEQQLKKLLEQADKDFDAGNYADAKGYYDRYLKQRPADTYSANRIKECDAKIKEKELNATELKKKADFDAIIAAGDGKVNSKDFDVAIVEYKKALAMNVDNTLANTKIKEATDAKAAFEKDKASQADAAAKKKLYDEAIAKAQKDFDAGEFTAAIEKYNSALTYIPDDAFAKAQIEKANAKIEEKKKFAEEQLTKLLEQADKDFDATKYTDAKGYYERYLKQRPGDAHSTARIKECDTKIAEGLANAKVDAAYKEFMAKADAAFSAKKYDDAISLYDGALGVKTGDADATTKKEQAIKAKADSANAALMAANKKKYDDIIKKATGFFDSGEFTSAITEYNNALAVIPADAYATAQIEKANAKIEEKKKFAEEQLAKLLEQADKDFSAEKYVDAKGYYERYLKQRPNDAHASARIIECDAKIAALSRDAAEKAKIDAAYNGFMAKGETAIKAKKFDEAILDFDAALGVKPGDALATEKKALAQKMKDDLNNASAQAVIKKRYDEFIAKANPLFDGGDFQKSIVEYNNALGVIPGDEFATKRIALANERIEGKKKEIEEMLAKLMMAADNEFKDGNWSDAKGYYERYIKIRPENTYAVDQIKICEAKIKEELANANSKAAVEARYKKFMEEGEEMAKLKKYDEAIMKFTGALETKPGDVPAQSRIDQINKIKNDLFNQAKANASAKENQARYDAAIALGNTELTEGDFDPAIDAYKDALNFKPLDKYATDQIKRCMKLKAEKIAAGAKMYADIIAKADQLFDAKNYGEAKGLYERAAKFKPDDTYPPQRIEECDKMMKKLANKEEYELVHVGKIVTGSTVLDGVQMIEAAKRQEKYQAEQTYVNIYDNNVKYHEGMAEDNNQEILKQQDNFNLEAFNRDQQFKENDEMRLYKVDSVANYIDVRQEAYRGILHQQDQSNLERQDKFNEFVFSTEQLFKDRDKMREYKADSMHFYKDYKDDVYRQTMKNSDQTNYVKQANFNEFELYTEQLYKQKDEMREYKADSVKFYKDYKDDVYRQTMKNSDQTNYVKQANFNEFEMYTEQLYKQKDEMREYKADSVKFYKDYKDDVYRQTMKNSDQTNYVKQANFNEFELYTEQLYKQKDEMREYKADSVKFYKDYKDQVYRETQKDQTTKNYNTQADFNQAEYDKAQLFKENDAVLRGAKVANVKTDEVNRETFMADVKTTNSGITLDNNNTFVTGEERRDAFSKERSGNYLKESDEYVVKNEIQNSTIGEFKKDGDQITTANNERFKTTSPIIPRNYDTGHLTQIAADYGPGIHQWTTHILNGNNVVTEIRTRRIVVKGGTANDYMMTVGKWGTNYTKNGQTIGDHVWQIETGGVIIEHDK